MTTLRKHCFAGVLGLAAAVAVALAEQPANPAFVAGAGTSAEGGLVLRSVVGPLHAGATAGSGRLVRGGFPAASLEIVLAPPGASFRQWMAALPPDQQPPPDQQGFFDEPAHDGVNNLMKHFLGLLPLVPSAHALPTLTTVDATVDGELREVLALELVRAADAEVAFTMEASTTLGVFQEVAFTTEVVADPSLPAGMERLRLVTELPVGDTDRTFIRLRLRPL
ncbi:MAG: hypothetical protein EA425_14300 [Puniceicoccaceae bacterium]|nr:MAG: hypothetical protein EA425_14300 [Puniceicoccaceae bacterium]